MTTGCEDAESNFLCLGRTSRRLRIPSYEVTKLANNIEEHTGASRKGHEPTRCSTLASLFSPEEVSKSFDVIFSETFNHSLCIMSSFRFETDHKFDDSTASFSFTDDANPQTTNSKPFPATNYSFDDSDDFKFNALNPTDPLPKGNEADTQWTTPWADSNGNSLNAFPSSTDWASTWTDSTDKPKEDGDQKFTINPIQPNHEWKTPSDSPESDPSPNDDENESADKWRNFKWNDTQNDNENDDESNTLKSETFKFEPSSNGMDFSNVFTQKIESNGSSLSGQSAVIVDTFHDLQREQQPNEHPNQHRNRREMKTPPPPTTDDETDTTSDDEEQSNTVRDDDDLKYSETETVPNTSNGLKSLNAIDSLHHSNGLNESNQTLNGTEAANSILFMEAIQV